MLYITLETDMSGYAATALFKDTPADSWYAQYVKTARARDSINGYQDGTFKPGQCVKRAEAIKIAVLEFNYGEIPAYTSNYGNLKDAPSTEWYYPYLNYALSANVLGRNHTNQIDATSFKFYPGEDMSRKEVAEMLYSMKTVRDNSLDSYDEAYEPNPLKLMPTEVTLKIDQIILTGNTSLEFDLYLSRPDLKLNQQTVKVAEEMPLTVDLPKSLQPKLMYVSDPSDTDKDSGSLCDRPRFPHRCSVNIPEDKLGAKSYTYLVKITFEDNSYASKEITVPYPKALEEPTITEPFTTPAQGASLDLSFKDVGAESYEAEVSLCHEYQDDGINPCLEGKKYIITKDSKGVFTADQPATITVEDGIINIKSDFKLDYEESVDYIVLTSHSWITDDGIKILTKNSYNTSFNFVPEI